VLKGFGEHVLHRCPFQHGVVGVLELDVVGHESVTPLFRV
jgi:hypothetical protein